MNAWGWVVVLAWASVASAAGPNIIYVMVDDMGYGDAGCYGQKVIGTPNIDRLAAEGLRFTDHYAGHTVCRPSRLVLWTGLHTGHTAIAGNAPYVLKPTDVTVAELLKKAGYVTGGVGKWANGAVGNSGHPNKKGFDFWMGYLDQGKAHNFYPEYLWRNTEKVKLKDNVLSKHPKARGRVSAKRVTYSHDVMTEEALAFIRRNKDKTFLLHVHWTIPHTNNEGGRVYGDGQEVPDYGSYKDRDWPNPEKGFAAMMERMDRDLGRMMALLKELKIDEKTIVFFTSDNGPHNEGGHKHTFFDSNGPLRGYKRDLYDGGIRVPFIARWPGRIKPGTVSGHSSAFWDFLPTACELAGAEVPGHVDGISYLPELLGKPQKKHDYLFWKAGRRIAVRSGKWKYVTYGKRDELYDLSVDIGESNNLAAGHPDVLRRLKDYATEARQK
ncbi:MAG: arylsulfatase [Phycisphaeraceae bacterium]|nr:arylsulfatase [Phycisphaeraceae bacterium]